MDRVQELVAPGRERRIAARDKAATDHVDQPLGRVRGAIAVPDVIAARDDRVELKRGQRLVDVDVDKALAPTTKRPKVCPH